MNNSPINNNELLQRYYVMPLENKRLELYNEILELSAVIQALIKMRNPNTALPSLKDLDNIKDSEIDENLYLTGLYEDILVFKEQLAFLLDEE